MLICQTKRLKIREITKSDAPFVHTLYNTDLFIQFVGDKKIKNHKDAEKYIKNNIIKQYQENGFGLYLVSLSEEEKSIGICGLIKRDYLENVDIGYGFLPDFFGHGYAFEAAKSILQLAKNVHKLNTVVAITLAHNHNCIKLLNKLGFKFQKQTHDPKTMTKLEQYDWKLKSL